MPRQSIHRMSYAERRERREAMVAMLKRGESARSVATHFDVTPGLVRLVARKAKLKLAHGGPRVRGNNASPVSLGAKAKVKFADVDWSKRDADIAAQVGCTSQWVQQVRAALGERRSAHHYRKGNSVRAEEWLKQNAPLLAGKSSREIARLAPVKLSYSSWHELRIRAGIPCRVPLLKSLTRETFVEHCTVTPRGCWEWNGRRHRVTGYGQQSDEYMHRFAYRLFVGDIPDGLGVLHSCDNPPCCNPSHLYVGTDADNAADRVARTHRGGKKLNETVVHEIRSRFEAGERDYIKLGREYGVCGSTIWNIVKRRYWVQVA